MKSRTGRLATLVLGLVMGLALGLALAAFPARAGQGERVQVTGEVIDTWCYLTDIMWATGTAHHQCAVWCAVGGVPVGLLGEDGTVYVVMKIEDDGTNVAAPKVLRILSHEVSVDGDLYVRDGINYLVVDRVEDDNGIVAPTHEDYGVQPWGE